jgi:hypothetical protein
MKLAGITAVALVVGVAVAASAQELSQEVPGHGKINWTDKTVTATGSGAPNLKSSNVAAARLGAERAAKLDAFRNILEAVKGAKVSGKQTVGAAMESSPEVKSRVEGVIKDFKVLDTKYYSDGGVDLIVQVPLSGIADAIVPASTAAAPAANAASGDATGIIINAKGLGVAPALAPRILDEKGAELYGPQTVSKDAMRANGVAAYSRSLDQAMKDGRISGKPMVIKAMKVSEPGSSDLVISGADAQKLGTLVSVLQQGKVIIVTD